MGSVGPEPSVQLPCPGSAAWGDPCDPQTLTPPSCLPEHRTLPCRAGRLCRRESAACAQHVCWERAQIPLRGLSSPRDLQAGRGGERAGKAAASAQPQRGSLKRAPPSPPRLPRAGAPLAPAPRGPSPPPPYQLPSPRSHNLAEPRPDTPLRAAQQSLPAAFLAADKPGSQNNSSLRKQGCARPRVWIQFSRAGSPRLSAGTEAHARGG